MAVKKFKVGAVSRTAKYGYFGVKVDGTDTWVNLKSIDGIDRGSMLQADVAKGKGGKLYAKNVKVLSGGSSGGGGGKSGGNYGNVDWNAATARAIEVTDLLIRHDAAKLGAKTKVEERKVAILDLIDELTARFYKELSEKKALKKAAEIDEELGDEAGDDAEDDESEAESDDVFGGDDDDDPFA